ncbi:uncharacterized protein AMSG_04708 [Thecamonas trahens ATCC 50062]|uniref:Uncharacterized protein n=1 Tax=Thecamonas trahens ATCC 50062 TaxID=461836 RepID=A0A0L0DCC7_THETB|nr:hypothetical protein AMSG_04708 [Thecamonas trahens ATCC 50062]KNC48963.1 hypothetical protein AMSG_04708 [Thecamonas trahens ATCC 50062]|eukprot:XP_013758380.1 hypothetical protein AMSG_04708 [Thecamonas trahens ATCC 50062]
MISLLLTDMTPLVVDNQLEPPAVDPAVESAAVDALFFDSDSETMAFSPHDPIDIASILVSPAAFPAASPAGKHSVASHLRSPSVLPLLPTTPSTSAHELGPIGPALFSHSEPVVPPAPPAETASPHSLAPIAPPTVIDSAITVDSDSDAESDDAAIAAFDFALESEISFMDVLATSAEPVEPDEPPNVITPLLVALAMIIPNIHRYGTMAIRAHPLRVLAIFAACLGLPSLALVFPAPVALLFALAASISFIALSPAPRLCTTVVSACLLSLLAASVTGFIVPLNGAERILSACIVLLTWHTRPAWPAAVWLSLAGQAMVARTPLGTNYITHWFCSLVALATVHVATAPASPPAAAHRRAVPPAQ